MSLCIIVQVLTELKQKALHALSLFKTTIAEDEKLKDTVPMYSNIRNCYIMRWGEKKVLQWFVDYGIRTCRRSVYHTRYLCGLRPWFFGDMLKVTP